MIVIITCKNAEDLSTNEGSREVTTFFSHYKSIGIIPDPQGQLTLQSSVWPLLNFKPIQELMVPFVTSSKNEEDPIKT